MTLVALLACTGGPATDGAPVRRSRVDAVLADPSKVPTPEAFCDQFSPPETARPFPIPVLDAAAWTPPSGWRWVNVWATWCGPCIDEMPRIEKWRDRLDADGRPIELVLVSVDSGRPEVSRFYDKHPEFPPTVRVADFSTVPEWLGGLGLDASTPIPIHVFVDPENRTRCVRTGSLNEHDYDAVKRVLGG